jgi:hypothetical protein
MDKITFNKLLIAVKSKDLTISNYLDKDEYYDLLNIIYEDIRNFAFYTFDGRFERILFNCLEAASRYQEHERNYKTFIIDVRLEFKKLIVPNIILIPFNYLNTSVLVEDIVLSKNIVLFANKESKSKIMKDKTSLSRHVESSIYATLNAQHILSVKDSGFFNYPIMAISINNIRL